MIAFSRPSFGGMELRYLEQAIRGGHVGGSGPFTERAETLLEQGHGTGRTLLTTSCTHALELAARLLDLRPGDEVIVPSYAFVTTASAFMLHGGTPVFVDVRNDTLNLDPALVESAITPRTRAICIVHYAGVGATPDTFRGIADRYGLLLIEDNAHSLYGAWRGKTLGTFGQLSTLSFHATKNITCGEGGALHINHPQFVERAEILRDKGTDKSRFVRGETSKYTWVDVGSSWSISDLLAGVLVGQLERFGEIHDRLHAIWNRYHQALSEWAVGGGVRPPVIPDGAKHTSHIYHLRFDSLQTRTRFLNHMRARDVTVVIHYQPLHVSAIGAKLGGRFGDCPVSEDAGDTLVRLPIYASLSDAELDHIIESVGSFAP